MLGRCDECGRGPLSECSNPNCGLIVRLFASASDCDSCGVAPRDSEREARLLAEYGPCPSCGGPTSALGKRCWRCGLERMLTQFKQQRERSAPGYDRMVERSRIMHEAWRAAGRPAKLQRTLIRSGDNWGEKWFVTSAWRRGENLVSATGESEAVAMVAGNHPVAMASFSSVVDTSRPHRSKSNPGSSGGTPSAAFAARWAGTGDQTGQASDHHCQIDTIRPCPEARRGERRWPAAPVSRGARPRSGRRRSCRSRRLVVGVQPCPHRTTALVSCKGNHCSSDYPRSIQLSLH